MPELYTTQFNDDKIYITFNEYVQLKDQQKELYTSPAMKKKPLLTQHPQKMQILSSGRPALVSSLPSPENTVLPASRLANSLQTVLEFRSIIRK